MNEIRQNEPKQNENKRAPGQDSTTNPSATRFCWHEARRLRFTGPGVIEFLQGYLTCDTSRINATQCVPMAICNLQGRVVANGWAYVVSNVSKTQSDNPEVALVVHETLLEATAAYFKPYIAFASCELTVDSESGVALRAMDIAQNHIGPALHPIADKIQDNLRLVIDLASDPSLDSSLPSIDDAVSNALVDARFVWLQTATSAQFLPQVLGLSDLGAVDFDKGCYLGQEIVARAQFRGAVKKGIQPFTFTQPPVLGEKYDTQTHRGVVVAIGQQSGLVVAALPPPSDDP